MSNKYAKMIVVFVLGGPGCGKSTQSSLIASHFGFKRLSVEGLIQAEIASASEAGKSLFALGKLSGVDAVLDLLEAAMATFSGCGRFIIDGFPCSLEQAQAFESRFCAPSLIILLEASAEVREARQLAHGGCESDTVAAICKHAVTFPEESAPVFSHYSSLDRPAGLLMKRVDGEPTIEEVFAHLAPTVVALVRATAAVAPESPQLYTLRKARLSDGAFLLACFEQALNFDPTVPFRSVAAWESSMLPDAWPEFRHYWQHWADPASVGILYQSGYIAVDAQRGADIGAVWVRQYPASYKGFAYLDSGTPEYAIGMFPGNRGMGVGTRLLRQLCSDAAKAGFPRLSLSAGVKNPALRLYLRLGAFQTGPGNACDFSREELSRKDAQDEDYPNFILPLPLPPPPPTHPLPPAHPQPVVPLPLLPQPPLHPVSLAPPPSPPPTLPPRAFRRLKELPLPLPSPPPPLYPLPPHLRLPLQVGPL